MDLKTLLSTSSIIAVFASLWITTYYVMLVDEPSRPKRHAVGVVIGLVGAALITWMVSPADGAAEVGWGWVLLAVLMAVVFVATAVAAPSSASDLMTQQAVAAPSSVPSNRTVVKKPGTTRAIRTGWRIADISFTYGDSEGDVTERSITVHSVNATYIKGECHAARAERTFRVDRVIGDVLDLDTGELLPARKWARNYS